MAHVQYRLHIKVDSLQFRGHINGISATSGDIALYIEQPFWRSYDVSFVTDISTGPGTFILGRGFLSSVDGSLTFYWPAS
jgi:hypothetical protein